jgi:hypothetical protein
MATRPLCVGIVMDPIESITPYKDSSLAMLLEAERREAEIHYFNQSDLKLVSGTALGRSRRLNVEDSRSKWWRFGEEQEIALGDLDVILMRKDPPFDMEYIYTTYILDRARLAGALIMNEPEALRNMNEKAYTAWFPECVPPTLITRSMDEMRAFLAEHRHAVIKPLGGMGGRSIFVIRQGDKNANVVFETLTDYGRQGTAAVGPRSRNMRPGGARTARRRGHLCRHRRDRRLPDRDQRDQPDRHARDRRAVRCQHGRPHVRCDRAAPRPQGVTQVSGRLPAPRYTVSSHCRSGPWPAIARRGALLRSI